MMKFMQFCLVFLVVLTISECRTGPEMEIFKENDMTDALTNNFEVKSLKDNKNSIKKLSAFFRSNSPSDAQNLKGLNNLKTNNVVNNGNNNNNNNNNNNKPSENLIKFEKMNAGQIDPEREHPVFITPLGMLKPSTN